VAAVKVIARLQLWLAALGALLAAFVATYVYGRRKGSKDAIERVSRRAEAAAEKREAKRAEIDADNDPAAARERLRTRWRD
jgi:Flp pilus assembly protein TadB